jgi:hypothetical protein
MKNKAEFEDVESVSNLVNDLYEKINEIMRSGGGAGIQVEMPQLASRSSVGQSRAGAQTMKEINETINKLKESIDATNA